MTEEMKIETMEAKLPNGQTRWMKVIKLQLPWPQETSETKEEFIVKKMNFGERSKYMKSFIDIKIKGQVPSTDVDLGGMTENAVLYALHKAPIQVTLENVQNFETYIADPLYEATDKLNSLGEITKDAIQAGESSDGPSNTGQMTKK